MILSAGKVFDRNDISKLINLKKERAVDVMITRLRQKIEPDPKILFIYKQLEVMVTYYGLINVKEIFT